MRSLFTASLVLVCCLVSVGGASADTRAAASVTPPPFGATWVLTEMFAPPWVANPEVLCHISGAYLPGWQGFAGLGCVVSDAPVPETGLSGGGYAAYAWIDRVGLWVGRMSEWHLEVDAPVALSGRDGPKYLYGRAFAYRVVGVPTEVSHQCMAVTTLDTHDPSARAPRPASCKRRGYVKFYYTTSDSLSPTGLVTILIRRGGRVVDKVVFDTRFSSGMLSHRYHCLLPRGTYRFAIRAEDLAGNRSAITTASVNRLVIY